MASGMALRKKVAGILKKMQVAYKPVYLRDTVVTAGDQTLGIGTTVTTTDTPVSPTPVIELVPSELVATSGGLYQPGDYRILFDGATEEATLRNCLIVYGEDVLKVEQIVPTVLGGVVVCWEVVARLVGPGD